MKTAIVGMGVIGKVHYQVLQELNADIVALCDVDSTKLSNDYVGEKFTDYEEMFQKENLDVITAGEETQEATVISACPVGQPTGYFRLDTPALLIDIARRFVLIRAKDGDLLRQTAKQHD